MQCPAASASSSSPNTHTFNRCLVTVEMGKALPVGQAVLASGVSFDAPKHIFLMLFILTDMKKPDTFFRPYYDLLPTTLSNMPIFWTEEEIRLLQGSYLVTQVRCFLRGVDAVCMLNLCSACRVLRVETINVAPTETKPM